MRHFLLAFLLLLARIAPAQDNTGGSASIQGVVTKLATGEPVFRARVILSAENGVGAARTILTGGDGKFLISNIPPGRYRLFASRDGYMRAEYGQTRTGRPGLPLSLAPRQELKDVALVLTPTGTISGRVFDRFGEPVSNANVQALKYYYLEGKRGLTVVQTARTNDLGEYRLFYLQPGSYVVSAVPTEMVRNDGGSVLVDVGPGSPIQLNGGTPGGAIRLGAVTGTAGGLVSAADTGETFLTVYYPGTTDSASAAPIDLRPGVNLTGVDFVTAETRAIRIRGTVSGPLNTASITLVARSGGVTRNLSTNNGSFEFRGIPPGSYDLIAVANAGNQRAPVVVPFVPADRGPLPPPPPPPVSTSDTKLGARLQIEAGNADLENIALVLQPGFTVSGRITVEGQASGEGQPNNNVMRVQLRSEINTGGLQGGIATSTAAGSFTLPAVFPGDYRVAVTPLPRNSYIKSARIGGIDALNSGLHLDGEPRGSLEIVIGRNAGTVDLRVVDERQNPGAGATVVLVPDAARRLRSEVYRTAIADAFGSVHFDGVVPGDYKAFAWQDVESGAWQDPDFLRAYEDRGKPLHIGESGKESAELRLIPPG
jgi:protocatechuate 3,4-dioxygenase beta subunit